MRAIVVASVIRSPVVAWGGETEASVIRHTGYWSGRLADIVYFDKNTCNSTNRGVHLLALRPMTFSVTAARFGALSESVAGRRHTHPDGQLVLSLQGVVACEARDAHWIIPPHCALWLPAGLPHVSRASPAAEGCFVFIPHR